MPSVQHLVVFPEAGWRWGGVRYLGGRVDPDGGVEQNVVAQLLQQRRSVGQAVQVFGKGQELLQDSPRDVHPQRLEGSYRIALI